MRVARDTAYRPKNGGALAPPLEPSTDDRNGSDSEQSSTPMKDAT